MDLFALDKTIFNFFIQISPQQEFEGLLFVLMGVFAWSGTFHSNDKRGKKK